MKTRNSSNAPGKKTGPMGNVVEITAIIRKKEKQAAQLKKLQEVRARARSMGINTRNVTLTELIRTIQKVEGNKDCYLSDLVLTCGQTNCSWREDCEAAGRREPDSGTGG